MEDEVAVYLNNRKRRELAGLEDDYELEVLITGQEGISPEFLEITCFDTSGRPLRTDA